MRAFWPPAADPHPEGVPLPRYEVRRASWTDAEWDRRVMEAGGTVFQSSAWGRLARTLGGDPVQLEIGVDGQPVGWALGDARRSRYPLLGRFKDRLVFETTPVMVPGHDIVDALDSIAAFARRNGFAHLRVGTTDGGLESVDSVPASYGRKLRSEFRIDLSEGFERAFQRMSAGHRRNVRRARKGELRVVADSTLDGAMVLRDLQDETFTRREALGHSRGHAWGREGFRKTMQAYLDAGVMRFWFAALGGERVSGVGILTFGARSYYLVGGTSGRGYEELAAFFLFDRVMRVLCEGGVTVLNLGGTPREAEDPGDEDHGLFRFKTGLGGRVLPLATLSRRL